MALVFKNMNNETSFEAGKQLRASELNTSFLQPIKEINAMSLAIASFLNEEIDVDLDYISETDLKNDYITALKSLREFRVPTTDNYAKLELGNALGTLTPYAILSANEGLNKLEVKVTPNNFNITRGNKSVAMNLVTSTITADIFDGLALMLQNNEATGSEFLPIWMGNENEGYTSSNLAFRPSDNVLKMASSASIQFGSVSSYINASNYTGTSNYTNSTYVTSNNQNNIYYLNFSEEPDSNGYAEIYRNSNLKVNPSSGTIFANLFDGVSTKANTIYAYSPSSSEKIYLAGTTETTLGYKSLAINENIYIKNNTLYAPYFHGEASLAGKANVVNVTTTSSNSSYYIPFVSGNSEGYKSLAISSLLTVNPSTKTISANISGTANDAKKFSSNKTISLGGMFTGSVTSDFADTSSGGVPTITISNIKYADGKGFWCKEYKQKAYLGIGVYSSSMKFFAFISIYNTGYGDFTAIFHVTSPDLRQSTEYHYGCDWRLSRSSVGSSTWYLQNNYGGSWHDCRTSDNDSIGTVSMYIYV